MKTTRLSRALKKMLPIGDSKLRVASSVILFIL
jgi:hypothetical protein